MPDDNRIDENTSPFSESVMRLAGFPNDEMVERFARHVGNQRFVNGWPIDDLRLMRIAQQLRDALALPDEL